MVDVLTTVDAPVPFSDVGGDRHSGALKLAREFESLDGRERAGRRVRDGDQVHGALPNDQIAITSYHRRSG